MTKSETKAIEAAQRTGNTPYIGRVLANLSRCASPRSQKEIVNLIESNPAIRATVRFDGGVYVASSFTPRFTTTHRRAGR